MSEEIKPIKIVDALKWIREHPEMHWGKQTPTYRDLVKELVGQMLVMECDDIAIIHQNGWYVISSSTNWLSPSLDEDDDLVKLFTKFHPLDDGVVAGGLKSEVFVYDFAEDIFVFFHGKFVNIKGDDVANQSVFMSLKGLIQGKTAIAFRGNTYV